MFTNSIFYKMAPKCYEIKSLNLRTNFEIRKYSKLQPVRDRLFVRRVKRYLRNLRLNSNTAMIDGDALASHMRSTYPEYNKRQYSAVKGLAGRVIARLSDDFNFQADADSDGGDATEEESQHYGIQDSGPYLSYDVMTDNIDNMRVSSDSSNEAPTHTYSGKRPVSDISLAESDVAHVLSELFKAGTPKYFRNGDSYSRSEQIPESSEVSVSSTVRPGTSSSDSVLTQIERWSPAAAEPPLKKRKVSTVATTQRTEDTTPDQQETFTVKVPHVKFSNIAGCKKVLAEILQLVIHVHHPEIFTSLGITLPRGFLLHGPPGCGKTLLAHAVAGELNVPLLDVPAPELVTGISGASEQRIRSVFEKAIKIAPCVVFIDEVDSITSNRMNSFRDMERRIVSQLLLSIDRLNAEPKGAQVLLIGATCRPDSLDPALRRAGRFDKEVCLGIPDVESRYEILKLLTTKIQLGPKVSLRKIANLTPGYVGADLLALIRESTLSAIHRVVEELSLKSSSDTLPVTIDLCDEDGKVNDEEGKVNDEEDNVELETDQLSVEESGHSSINVELEEPVPDITQINDTQFARMLSWISSREPVNEASLKAMYIKNVDFEMALKRVQPSAKREGFATIPDVTWDDIGSLKDIRHELHMSLIDPVKHQKLFQQIGVSAGMGVMLCGPPGCGKTLLAKAIANEAGINFISVKGPELLNMYVGGSERAVRACFHRARNSQPCIIFFDEIDALCPKRTDFENGGTSSRVVNQLLTEMDGIEARQNVYLMAATNRPDIVDPAIMRPGRFDKVLYVGFPNADDRVDIIRAITKKGKHILASDVDLEAIGKDERCNGYTGADLAALVREATMIALYEHIHTFGDNNVITPQIYANHFDLAMSKIIPSVGPQERVRYEEMQLQYKTTNMYKVVDETTENGLEEENAEQQDENLDTNDGLYSGYVPCEYENGEYMNEDYNGENVENGNEDPDGNENHSKNPIEPEVDNNKLFVETADEYNQPVPNNVE